MNTVSKEKFVSPDSLLPHDSKSEKDLEIEELSGRIKNLEHLFHIFSHDLRTPMINILGFGQLLERTCQKLSYLLPKLENKEDVQKDLELLIRDKLPMSLEPILSGISKMDTLLEALLKLSRLLRSEMNFSEINMNEFLPSILSSFSANNPSDKVSVEALSLPSCLGDKGYLQRVFTAILENSLKYKSSDKLLRIEIQGFRKNNFSIYSFSDNGTGIPPEKQEDIWTLSLQSLQDEKSSSFETELPSAKVIVEKHHGKIWMQSEQNNGTTIFVQLPSSQDNKTLTS